MLVCIFKRTLKVSAQMVESDTILRGNFEWKYQENKANMMLNIANIINGCWCYT